MTVHLGRRVLGATAGLLCGSVLWALNTQLGEILPYPECRLRLPFTGPGSSLALIASLIAGYWSWRVWLSLWDQRDAQASDTDASAAGGDRRRRRADFCAGARTAGCRWLHSQRMRTMTAHNPAASFVQVLCTQFGVTGSEPGSGAWTFDLWITLPLMLSLVLYGI